MKRGKIMKVKVLVATHKAYAMPKDKELYEPIQVGKILHPELNLKCIGDDTGDNISNKNPSYNELTALYWAWKNLTEYEAIGLVHYRRYLSLNRKKSLVTILNQQQIETLLQEADIILPKKRRYYIESNYSHYAHAHHIEPLDLTRDILASKYPTYLATFDIVMNRKSAHMFNMFIMKKNKFDQYAEWLFDILNDVEKQIDTTNWSTYEQRVYGFISERLLDVWLETNHYAYKEVNYVHMEKQNWPKKIGSFLWRKFRKPSKELGAK